MANNSGKKSASIKKHTLKNGLRVIYKQNSTDIIAVNVSVLCGSNNENEKIQGISHFIEHMLFEGTIKRTALEISSEIEKYGGEMNAYTSSNRTNFYIKIHRKYAKKAIEILSDMIINPRFDQKAIEKEKNVVIEEINMVNDDPKLYQWVFLQKKLFEKPMSFPTYGTKEAVSKLKKQDLVHYHKKHYAPSNVIITLVGNYPDYRTLVAKFFRFKNKNTKIIRPSIKTPNKKRIFEEKRKNINQQYLIIAYKTKKRFEKDSYELDVIAAMLAKGQSGRLFDEIRTKRGLTYDLGVYHNPNPYYGIFAFFSSASKEKISTIEKIYFDEIKKLKNTAKKELNEAISHIVGNQALKLEDSHEQADMISFYEECGDYQAFNRYLTEIKKVTLKDIKKAVDLYLNDKYTKILIK